MIGVYVVGIAPCSATLASSGLAQSTASVSGTTERIQERSYQFEEAGLRMTYRYIEVPGGDHFSSIDSGDNVQAIFDFFDQARRN